MICRKAICTVALSLLFATYLSAANTTLVHGPTVFTVHSGPPASETVSFTLPRLVYGPFTLLADHKDVTGVNVELNGATILDSEAFDSRPLRAIVHLKADNTLTVGLTGPEGASLTIMIMGYEYEHAKDYQDPPVASPETSNNDLPAEVDWRTKGVVTPVKNQGQCDSGWAFSATGAVESVVAIKTGSLKSLSEQQLVDCSGSYGNYGCNGGSAPAAFKYIIGNGGIEGESSYPYTARDGRCRFRPENVVARISGSSTLDLHGDEQALQALVAQQPVSVEVDASGGFRSYHGGVFSGPCGRTLDQPVLIVGYDQTSWIVKNSWGTSWGMSGYILMERGKNLCGIAESASVPILSIDNVSNQTVTQEAKIEAR
jgi:cathepsin L